MKVKAEAVLGVCGACQKPRRIGLWSEQGQVEWGAVPACFRPGSLAGFRLAWARAWGWQCSHMGQTQVERCPEPSCPRAFLSSAKEEGERGS